MQGETIAEFRAIIPDIQSAIKLGGSGESRVQFDVPASDIAEVMKLAGFGTRKVLRIAVEVDKQDT